MLTCSRQTATAGALVLASCLAAGLVVVAHPTEPGRLRVSPSERLTTDLRAGLLLHRDAVLAELAAKAKPPEPRPAVADRYGTAALLREIGAMLGQDEDYQERAAILEFDAGMAREDAEAEARRLVYGGV